MTGEGKDLTLRQAQQTVDQWVQARGGGYWSVLSNVARLAEEVGEVARVANHLFGEKPKKPEEPPQDLGMELCDVLYTLICLANSQGIDLQDSFERTLEKYRQRDWNRYVRD
ncbi:MAG: nucleotide pyrophosphohydrolase [Deinococcus sp.]|nr:nucleotide pyrophosphohydrolase [Deinococcus sp.]